MSSERGGRAVEGLTTGPGSFISRHGLWSDEQQARASELLGEIERLGLESIRVAYSDPHGSSRSKSLTPRAFSSALQDGLGFSCGPLLFDTGATITAFPFQPGGGLGVEELTGAASIVLVPDPLTFRVLPWAEATGWVVADDYLASGAPVPFSARHLLRGTLGTLGTRGLHYLAGLEVEWFLTRLVDPRLTPDSIGRLGAPGAPPEVAPVDLGHQLNLELLNDALADVLVPLQRSLVALELPLRSVEHETGPGQIELTFDPMSGLEAADAMFLLRTATKQICARRGYHATFMSAPGIPGFDVSGWHLHQSLLDAESGANELMPTGPGEVLSSAGIHFVGGLLEHARAASIFAVPTVNGYKRLHQRFALTPDRATWSHDNRGTFIRVLAGPDDPMSHLENRQGEPCANPYLYLASQVVAGLDGMDTKADPGPPTHNPHHPDLVPLPRSLGEAIECLRGSGLFRTAFGDAFVDHYLRLKESEWRRYREATAGADDDDDIAVVTEWEQREYFRIF